MKEIKNYEGYYSITEDGEVYSDRRGKYLKQYQTPKGYKTVHLSVGNCSKGFQVHRLVAEAFIPNPNNYPQVNHKDENPSNNHVSNLEWVTAEENINYRSHNSNMIKTQSYPVLCVELNKMFLNARIAASEFNLNRQNIQACCNGKRGTCGGFHWKYCEEREGLV